MYKKHIVANWKMNMTSEDVHKWLSEVHKLNGLPLDGIRLVLAPTFVHLSEAFHKTRGSAVSVSAQDVSPYTKGSHTGEVGVFQLMDFCTYCIVGHSERAEGLTEVLTKRDLCLSHGITPIVCFEDPLQVKDYYAAGAILAWENPSNISKNGVYSNLNYDEISEKGDQIKKALPEGSLVLYGGSVNRDNIETIALMPSYDGVLVGGASLDFVHFSDIIKKFL